MSKIIWSPKAVSQLQEIHDYIAKDSKVYAKNVAHRILDVIEAIAKSPDSGRVVPEFLQPEIKERRYGNYRIIYRLKEEVVEIAAIYHTAQLPKFES